MFCGLRAKDELSRARMRCGSLRMVRSPNLFSFFLHFPYTISYFFLLSPSYPLHSNFSSFAICFNIRIISPNLKLQFMHFHEKLKRINSRTDLTWQRTTFFSSLSLSFSLLFSLFFSFCFCFSFCVTLPSHHHHAKVISLLCHSFCCMSSCYMPLSLTECSS